MIKAVFLDVDGTIISIRTHTIPKSAAAAIHKARLAGIKVFLCTSRAKQFLSNIKEIECDGIVALTGAHCIDSEGNDICTMPMSPSDIANAITDVQKSGKELVLISAGKVYMANIGKTVIEYLGTGGLTLDDIPGGVSALPDFVNAKDPVSLAESLGILQITGFFPSGEEDRRFLSLMPDSHTERWTEVFVDIVRNGISKALGIDVMARRFGFDASETMGIGDGANDIPMIEHAAIGVAMGNASDHVKSHADFVTDDVDDDGLSKAFEKFLNL
jgi:Predicted hydrolases of the HAD superfamily